MVGSCTGIVTTIVGSIMLVSGFVGILVDYLDDFKIEAGNNWYIPVILSIAPFIISIEYMLISMKTLSNKGSNDTNKDSLIITPNMPGNNLAPIAMPLHNITGGMPIVIKSKNNRGVLVENGAVNDIDFKSDVLDSVFIGERAKSVRVNNGKYAGALMFISAITDRGDEPIAAIGIIDLSGILNLKEFMDTTAHIDEQIHQGT